MQDLSIYIITHPKFQGQVKIGRSVNMKSRLTDYNVGCPDKAYKCYFSIRLPESTVSLIERHFVANVSRASGEWFNVSPETAKEIIIDVAGNPLCFIPATENEKELPLWDGYPVELNSGLKLKRIRLNSRKTQEEFAAMIGIKRSSIGAYEEGRAKPSIGVTMSIIKQFGRWISQPYESIHPENSFMVELFNKYRLLKGKEKRIVDFALGFDD